MRIRLSAFVLIATVFLIAGCGGGSSKTGSIATGSTSSDAAGVATTGGGTSSTTSTTAPAGKSLSALQLAAQADAICKRLNAELVAAKDRVTSQQEMVRITSQRAAVEQNALNELSKLTPPTAIAADWQQMISDRRTLIEDLNKISVAAEGKDVAAEGSVIRSSLGLEQQLLVAAERGGFKGCGKVG